MRHLFSPISLFTLIDFLGVFVAAVGGALDAAKNEVFDYDIIGVTGLALVSALGGGITRDLILQHGPPLAFVDVRYLLDALLGALLVIVLVWGHAERRPGPVAQRLIAAIDAASIGLFAVAGATRAVNVGLTYLPALILGMITAVGGGSLRDVLSGRTPKVFLKGQPYAIAAMFSGIAFLSCWKFGMPQESAAAIGGFTGFAVRMLALRYGWKTRAVRVGS
ncbi:MAG: TRIC cation channel family protein [Acidobacteriales bacterium]|nr:TRIC cation channel family protein [Terriglobales bacterium]